MPDVGIQRRSCRTILALFLLSAALLFSYMHTLNQSDAWVDDAYKFFSRVAPR